MLELVKIGLDDMASRESGICRFCKGEFHSAKDKYIKTKRQE